MRKIITAALAVLCVFTACTKETPEKPAASAPAVTAQQRTETAPQAAENETAPAQEGGETVSGDNDELPLNARVTLSEDSINVNGSGVNAYGTLLNISRGGAYEITGTMTGQITVDVSKEEKVEIILNGADITAPQDAEAVLLVRSADKVIIRMQDETQNGLSSFSEDSNTSGISADDDITFKGEGTLTVKCKGDGIYSKNDIRIKSGNINVYAGGDGIKGKDSVSVSGGTLNIESAGNALVSNNKDETHGNVDITGGIINISSIGENAKGIKAQHVLTIGGGDIRITSQDDAINGENVTITDGDFFISSGADAIHADIRLDISGGTGNITRSTEGFEGMSVTVSGGEWRMHASDDGINATDGSADTVPDFNMPEPPDFGDAPDGDEDKPDFGDMPDFGDVPEAPDFGAPAGGAPMGGREVSPDVYFNMSGGKVYVEAGGDGVDSNGNVEISGGELIVDGPADDYNAPLDFDGGFTVTGGTVIAAGSSGMAQIYESSQPAVTVFFSTVQEPSEIKLISADGDTVCTHAPVKRFAFFTVTSPDIADGTYSLEVGGEKLCEIEVSGNTIVNDKGEAVEGGGMFGRPPVTKG